MQKTPRPYQRPQIHKVKLAIEESVLQACKARDGDPAGKMNKACGHPGCKREFGS